jgi:hypothetical protein
MTALITLLAWLAQDPLEAAQAGRSVDITLKNGRSIQGVVRLRTPTALTLEPSGLKGELTLELHAIAQVRLIGPARARVETAPIPFGAREIPVPPVIVDPVRTKDPGPLDDLIEKAKLIYAEFPEDDGWGEARHKQLKAWLIPTGVSNPTHLDVRIPIKVGKMDTYGPAPERDARFLENYGLWKVGRELSRAAALNR